MRWNGLASGVREVSGSIGRIVNCKTRLTVIMGEGRNNCDKITEDIGRHISEISGKASSWFHAHGVGFARKIEYEILRLRIRRDRRQKL